MAYLNKQSVLKAYKELSDLRTGSTKQGLTQYVSALRHFSALDRFYKINERPCNTRDRKDKNEFVQYVGEVCSVTPKLYTSNFYLPLAESKNDYSTGSNFYSQGQVKVSLENTSKLYVYPARGSAPLMQIKNGELYRVVDFYKNIYKYLTETRFKAAFAIWILRDTTIDERASIYDSLKETLLNNYTQEFADAILPNDKEINDIITSYGIKMDEQKEAISESDIKSLFDIDMEETPKDSGSNSLIQSGCINVKYRPYVTAIKTKPFLLLAGISGTGKSRIVRELARACWDKDSDEFKAQKPKNFEMVQVKPNWHDSSELIGYVSRVSGKPTFIVGDALRFIAKAWEDLETPYFLCLDEMNLAPVEQYFAEYLSVVESRKTQSDGTVITDPILRKEEEEWFFALTAKITESEDIRMKFNDEGIAIPQNLIVVGTVNMDETTFSFSRKVLDRAMTIEMNEVDLYSGLKERDFKIGKLNKENLIGIKVEGVDVYGENKEVCDKALEYLQAINDVLEGTPFKVAYRTRNEFLLYVVNNLPYDKDEDGNSISEDFIIARALDEITSMKVLSRIEGDDTKVSDSLLEELKTTISDTLQKISEDFNIEKSVSLSKLKEMKDRLSSGYTSFWS